MFCNASIGATEDQQQKLDKLLKLWESKANYLDSETVEKMHQPIASYQLFKNEQVTKYATEVAPLAQQTKTTYDGYQAQHQAFVCHAMQQILTLQQQKQTLENQMQNPFSIQNQIDVQLPIANTESQPTNSNIIPLDALQANLQQTMAQQQQHSVSENGNNQQLACMNPPNPNLMPPDSTSYLPPLINPNVPPPNLAQAPPNLDCNLPPFNQPPPGFFPPPAATTTVFPDFSKPPPGFAPPPPPPEPVAEELLPTVPYYDLPAGLMVPLIKLEDTSFKPLDPKDIRLPPPQPPSDRLLAAVEDFYAPPTHERPRDSEGWEKLGLFEYYKAKNGAKKEKDDAILAGIRDKSRSPSPVVVPMEREPSPPKRRYTSLSPSPVRVQRSRSHSRSPRRSRRRSSSRRRSKRSSSHSRSRSRSHTPPARILNRSPSPTPQPSFSTTPFNKLEPPQELDSSNKGHQMLCKMGWGGSGLGANEQGIDSPISGGEVRDRQDQFKGIGCDLNDPYENFRKNKGAAFITRMKARAEERASENKVYD